MGKTRFLCIFVPQAINKLWKQKGKAMSFVLPDLPYPRNALAPHISEETVNFHYGKHHAGYVTRLNSLVKDTPTANKSLEEIIKTEGSGPIFNCAAQTWNHTFYWNCLAANAGGEPHGPIKDAINKDFGSFENFKKEFNTVATGHFGSGWAWLVQDPADNKLKISQTHDAACPIRDGLKPILVNDIWEHAYYIDYRNDRAAYVNAFWNLVNWEFVNKNLSS